MGISICVATYNRLPQVKRLLDSIHGGFGDYPYEVIFADGGSTDGTIEYLRTQDKVTLIEQGELTGATKAYNACFKIAKYEYIFWPADDFVLVPKVLVKACHLMDNYPEIGLVGPKVKEPRYGNLAGVELTFNFLVLTKMSILRTSLLKEANYLDENYRTYCTDDDACLTVLKQGFTIIFTKEVGCMHNRIYDELWTMNQRLKKGGNNRELNYFYQKWAELYANLDKYVSANPVRKYKSIFFKHICDLIFSRLAKPAQAKNNGFTAQWYDHLLEQCVVFKAKEYDHLKDFYLAQKLPKEVISTTK